MKEKSTIKEIRSLNKMIITSIIISLFGILLMFRSHSLIIEIIGFILFLLGVFYSFVYLAQKENLANDDKIDIKKIKISFVIISFIISLFGIMLMFRSHSIIVKIIGFILFILGLLFSWGILSVEQDEKEKLAISERRKHIIDKIGGAENIDINLSEYGDRNQLIILKDKSILIGYNNYETDKIINFNSIINVDIRINNIKEESLAGYKHYHRDVIESIIVYIHTNECTEELIFSYPFYENNKYQEKYNEILTGLNRFKAILGDTLNTDTKMKSVPLQIKEYKELLDIGAITEEEYEVKKNELLSK